jgi:hypothetical protein
MITNLLNLLPNNNFTDSNILIGCGIFVGCSLYYLIRSNNTITNENKVQIPNTNIEDVLINNNSETENENRLQISNANIEDVLIDSDSDTETDYDGISDYESFSASDLDEILNEPDFFIFRAPYVENRFRGVDFTLPDLDFNICPIEELKLYEICSLYSKEMVEHGVSEAEMMELIS